LSKGRKRGAQPGNLNALKHGYYSRALTKAQQLLLERALAIPADDLSGEIALLRQRLFTLLEAAPDKVDTLCEAMRTLARLAATHYHLKGSDADRLAGAMANVLASIEATLGAPSTDGTD
jgi:hypothetical protein